MATNDFIHDLIEKLAEENIEYLLISVQKGKKEHKANAFFNITTVDGADMIFTTVEEVIRNLQEGKDMPDEIDLNDPDRHQDGFAEGAD